MRLSTLTLIKDNLPIILSGFLLVFFSVFGQSVFIGTFMPHFREELGLSQVQTGSLYGAATFSSAILMFFVGRKLDDVPFLYFLGFTLVGLSAGSFLMSIVSGPITLFLALLALRQFGLGQMIFSANTSVNRYLEQGRGRAMAITTLGGPLHIAVFPPLALLLLSFMSWHSVWVCIGFFILIFLCPLFFILLKDHERTTHKHWQERTALAEAGGDPATGTLLPRLSLRRKDVLKDWKFYAITMILLIVPCLTTVIFFFQSDLSAAKGLSPAEFSSSLLFYTCFSIGATLLSGMLIDRYGEAPSLFLIPVLYACGLLILVFMTAEKTAFLSLALFGACDGISRTSGGPVLARLYGTKYLGAVKSMSFSFIIVASALSPALAGFLLDRGVNILTVFKFSLLYIIIAFAVALPALKHVWAPDPA